MLYVRERHTVKGLEADAFEAAFRDEWMPTLASGADARLLRYFEQAHGAGPSYTAITYTAYADAAAWQRTVERIQHGDLQAWARQVDATRERVDATLLVPLEWSPSVENIESLADGADSSETALYLEDTVWPHPDQYRRYVETARDIYRPSLGEHAHRKLEIELAARPGYGAGRRPEVRLLQRIVDTESFVAMLSRPTPADRKAPGTWMHDALELRDQWRSRLLRTVPWSPASAPATGEAA